MDQQNQNHMTTDTMDHGCSFSVIIMVAAIPMLIWQGSINAAPPLPAIWPQ